MRHWGVHAALLSIAFSASTLCAQEIVHPVLTLAADASAATGRRASISRLRFQAYGRDFTLDLQNNDRLKADLPPTTQARLEGIRLYRGELEGYPGSWLRLTVHDDVVSGVIFDGADLYRFHQEAGRSTIQLDLETDVSAGSLVGDVVRTATSEVVAADDRKTALGMLGLPLSPGKTLAVGVVADSAYAARHFDFTQASLLETMNVVDGIFVWQLGVRISLAELKILDASNDPFVDAGAAAFLSKLSALKTATPALASLGLVHLFTGRDVLGGPPGGSLVGAANLDKVCDLAAGVGITEGRSTTTGDAHVAAHEIGHNLGAPHDNEAGSACAATPAGFLMDPFVNGSSEFSPCSIDRLLAVVASRTCFVVWQPNDLAVRVIGGTSETDLLTEKGFLSVAIDNADIGAGNAVELTIETTASISLSALYERLGTARIGFTCERTNDYGRCTASYLPAGSTASFDLEFYTLTPDGGTITVTVNSGNDPNASNDSLVFPVTVPPAADIAASMQLPPGQARAGDRIFYPGDFVEVAATVRNLSATTATNAVAIFNFSPSESDYAVAAPIGVTCTVATYGTRYDCKIGALPGGERRDFVLRFRTQTSVGDRVGIANDTVSMTIAADQHDPYRENNQATEGVSATNGIFDLVLDAVYPDAVEIGTPATFTLSLQNLGPDAARFVSLRFYQVFGPPSGFEFLSVTSNLADCSRAQLQADWSCDLADTLASGETLLINYGFVAKGPLDFFAMPRFEYAGYELGMNAEPPTIHIHAGAPPSTPPPIPPPPPPPPAASGSGGGGGAADILTLVVLLLAHGFSLARGRIFARRLLEHSERGC